MKFFNKMCLHDNVSVTLNADEHKYLNYDTRIIGEIIGSTFVRCHDYEGLNLIGIPRKIKSYDVGYTRVRSPERISLQT